MASSVDPTVEMVAIKAKLDALTGVTYEGVPQGFHLPVDGFGNLDPYRDFEAGSVIPSASGRLMAGGEQDQPHIWAFQVHHRAASRKVATDLAIETDLALIGWAPSNASSPIKTFFFTVYDETAKSGERIGWIATRFYETTLGQIVDFGGTETATGTPVEAIVSDPSFEFVQSVAQSTWTVPIPSDFGRKPAVEVYNTSAERVFPDVNIVGSNAIITFATPVAGTAVLT